MKTLLTLACLASLAGAQTSDPKRAMSAWIDEHRGEINEINRKIWTYAETGLQETRSSAELKTFLTRNGAVKQWMERTKTPGTIRLYGTPAEEALIGKIYMLRARAV